MPRPSYLLEFAGSMASVATHALVRKTYALLASTLVVTAVAALFGTSMAFPSAPLHFDDPGVRCAVRHSVYRSQARPTRPSAGL